MIDKPVGDEKRLAIEVIAEDARMDVEEGGAGALFFKRNGGRVGGYEAHVQASPEVAQARNVSRRRRPRRRGNTRTATLPRNLPVDTAIVCMARRSFQSRSIMKWPGRAQESIQ